MDPRFDLPFFFLVNRPNIYMMCVHNCRGFRLTTKVILSWMNSRTLVSKASTQLGMCVERLFLLQVTCLLFLGKGGSVSCIKQFSSSQSNQLKQSQKEDMLYHQNDF